jgi:hypothetical protein
MANNIKDNIYIGTRDFTAIAKIFGKSPPILNEGMSKLVRSGCLLLGIKKTEQGKRLYFYSVSKLEYKKLTDEKQRLLDTIKGNKTVHHLVKIEQEKFNKVFASVNAQYGSQRMDYKTYDTYKRKMAEAMSKIIEVTGADHNIRKKAQQIGVNPYKVGDILKIERDYNFPKEHQGKNYCQFRVTWSGKRQIEVESLGPRFAENGHWPNTESIVKSFQGVIAWGLDNKGKIPWSGSPHGHFVPLKGNEALLKWYPVGQRDWETKEIKSKRYQWTKFAKVKWSPKSGLEGYDSLKCDNPTPGYYYNYNGSSD